MTHAHRIKSGLWWLFWIGVALFILLVIGTVILKVIDTTATTAESNPTKTRYTVLALATVLTAAYVTGWVADKL